MGIQNSVALKKENVTLFNKTTHAFMLFKAILLLGIYIFAKRRARKIN